MFQKNYSIRLNLKRPVWFALIYLKTFSVIIATKMKRLYFIFLLTVITIQVFTLTTDNLYDAEESSSSSDSKVDSWSMSWPSLGAIKQKLGRTVDSASQVITETTDTISQKAKNAVESISIQDKIDSAKELAQPYAESIKEKLGVSASNAGKAIKETAGAASQKVKNAVGSINIQETIESVKKSTQPYTESITNKLEQATSGASESLKKVTNVVTQKMNDVAELMKIQEKVDYVKQKAQPLVETITEKAISHIILMKEYTASNVNMQDIELFMDIMSDFIPGARIFKTGGRIILSLASNTEDITDLVGRLNKLIAAGETKQAAREILRLLKKIGSSKDLLRRIYNILRRE